MSITKVAKMKNIQTMKLSGPLAKPSKENSPKLIKYVVIIELIMEFWPCEDYQYLLM